MASNAAIRRRVIHFAFSGWAVALLLTCAGSLHTQPAPKDAGPAKSDKSPLDQLSDQNLTPFERQEMPGHAVAILRGSASYYASGTFTGDGGRLAMGRADGKIDLWVFEGGDAKQQSALSPPGKIVGAIHKMTASADGKWLISVHGLPGTDVVAWRLTKDGADFVQSVSMVRADDVAFHPNSKFFVTGTNGANLYAVSDKGVMQLPGVFGGACSTFAFTSDGKFVATISTPMGKVDQVDSEVMMWSCGPNCENIREYNAITQEKTIKTFAVSRDGKWLATSSVDDKMRLWDLTKSPPTSDKPLPTVSSLKALYFNADGNYLIGFSNQLNTYLWDVAGGKEEKAWEFKPKVSGPFATGNMWRTFSASAVAPDGRHVVVSNNTPNVIIMRFPTGKK